MTVLLVVMTNVKEIPIKFMFFACTIVILIMVALNFQEKFVLLITIILLVAFGIMFCLLLEVIYNFFKKNYRMVLFFQNSLLIYILQNFN